MKSYPLLSAAISIVEWTLDCEKDRQVADKIEIYPLNKAQFGNNENKLLAEKGFGNCLIKSFDGIDYYVSIAINTEKCKKADLSEREISSIILHELGHILNEPELKIEPTLEYCFINGLGFNKQILNEIREYNSIAMETYADYYASKYGFGKELISTFQKQDKNFEQKIGFKKIRINKILNQEVLIGGFMKNKNTAGNIKKSQCLIFQK